MSDLDDAIREIVRREVADALREHLRGLETPEFEDVMRDVDECAPKLYVIALDPRWLPRRIKVGFTSRPIVERMSDHATTMPTLRLLACWNATREDEQLVHRTLRGAIGPEVYDVDDVREAIAVIDGIVRQRSALLQRVRDGVASRAEIRTAKTLGDAGMEALAHGHAMRVISRRST